MELRDEVAAIVREACDTKNRQFAYAEFADRILTIPEIADALRLVATMSAHRNTDFRIDATGRLIGTQTVTDLEPTTSFREQP